MSPHVKRGLSPCVQEISEELKFRRMLKMTTPSTCRKCSKAKLQEVLVNPDAIHTRDPRIGKVIVYTVNCPYHEKPILYDRSGDRCFRREPTISNPDHRCSTCKFGVPIQVDDVHPPIRRREVPCKVVRTLYECTNRNRMQQINKKKVYMAGYICCEHYEPKEMAE